MSENATAATQDHANPVLRVGMLRGNPNYIWKPQNTSCAMMYTAKQFDIELFLFRPEDVDLETRTINGMFLVGNEKVRKRVPFPPIIENSILNERLYGNILNELEKECILIRHPLTTTKLRTYNTLLKDGRFTSLLIPTEIYGSCEQIVSALDKHESIVLKPASGGRGSGVRRLSRQGELYFVTENNVTTSYSKTELAAFLKVIEDRKVTYLWQPFVVSRTENGNPFDVRIHARRGKEGKFQIHLFPRIGNAKGIVSNISTGGYSMDIDVFLRDEFGDDHKKIKQDLLTLGSQFPEYYQSFHKPVIFDVGMDVGIQSDNGGYNLKLFEVNTYIDGPFFEIEDAITHFEYFRYLYETQKRQKDA